MRGVAMKLTCSLLAATAAFACPSSGHAGTFKTLYSFGATSGDGRDPTAGLIVKNGVLYGTTARGGASGYGTVFSFNPATASETVLASTSNETYAGMPVALAGGRIFGTGSEPGNDLIYEANPKTGRLSIVYTFPSSLNDIDPGALVEIGGKIYGNTNSGGADYSGTVFEYDPVSGIFNTIYTFTGSNDGRFVSNLVVQSGLLYGVTTDDGAAGYGTIFTVDPSTGAETTLYTFTNGPTGGTPKGITISHGIIYGLAQEGGTANAGTLFSFDPVSSKLTTIYSFPSTVRDQCGRSPPVEAKGRLFGTTEECDIKKGGFGTLYEVSVKTGRRSVLHIFRKATEVADGANAIQQLLSYKGFVYGVTQDGGAYNSGTIFSYTP
jgi:uncharacterized repeat protein (TIGR03803 family)